MADGSTAIQALGAAGFAVRQALAATNAALLKPAASDAKARAVRAALARQERAVIAYRKVWAAGMPHG